ncbi:RagB/SusD family nutrient uptake outer membrane protein [Flammeovirgaceae bacterium SG7u.111]|nr:RagB/SusD family nutrient uptake outer membrane protein [Flammeovirgaceae bacterium SG7u.132]WPO33923.1 RagB/SusD family nutrient uptake outer membrane protein [Flammeovirgaceae bacterium SG7u.111]
MRKKIVYKLLVIGIVLGVFGCTDLKENPIALLAPNTFFQSPKDVEAAVMGTYADIANEEFYGRKLVLSLLLRGDMADIGDRNTPGRRQQVNDFNMDSNNGMITAFWPRGYKIIGSANAAIAGAELVGEPAAEVNALKAEAMFIRAFTYYHLVRLFGDIPYIDFFITDPEAVKTISKTPTSTVYQSIIADLEYAKANLPDQHAGNVKSRPTKGTAAAYLASVYLTMGDDQKALTEAEYVISNASTFGYRLMPDFVDLFDPSATSGVDEHIFMIDFLGQVTGTDLQQNDWMGPITGIRSVYLPDANSGWSVAVPTMEVYESWDDRDYRKEVSMIDEAYADPELTELVGYEKFAPNHGSPRPHIGKYWGRCGLSRGDCGQSDINYAAMRYAEVLLIAAEAADNLSQDGVAAGYLNQVRARARNWAGAEVNYPADYTAAEGDLTEAIREERRLELAFEYKRWYDIKRWDIGDEVFKGANSLEPHADFDKSVDYLFPLPQDELDRNENLKPQNPGY